MIKSYLNRIILLILFAILYSGALSTTSFAQKLSRLNTVVELDVGDATEVELINGEKVKLKLKDIKSYKDNVRGAVRSVSIKLEVNGESVTIGSGLYHLPTTVGNVKIDCPVIKDFTVSGYYRFDGVLPKDARFRLWPKDSPFIQPGTFGYPLKQAWLIGRMQSQNELAGLGWAESMQSTPPGYHAPHDFGGAEGMEEIFAATDGLIVSANKEVLEGYEDLPGDVRTDVVWVVDDRNWYYRYSHLNSVEAGIVPGAKLKLGQKIGYMGKQGGSGGWVHLHFGVHHKNPGTAKWEVEDAYPYLWEAYQQKYNPKIVAIARPRLISWTNENVTLDGTPSFSLEGDIVSYEWQFHDGKKAKGAIQKRKFSKAGEYSEILKVTDSEGNVGYDFAYVQVFDKKSPENQVPTIHPVYYPTTNIKAGDPVTFLVRTFGSKAGEEEWDFGDGTAKVTVNSGIVERKTQNEGKYAETIHKFDKPGQYIVKVQRTNEHGYPAIGHLHVTVK